MMPPKLRPTKFEFGQKSTIGRQTGAVNDRHLPTLTVTFHKVDGRSPYVWEAVRPTRARPPAATCPSVEVVFPTISGT